MLNTKEIIYIFKNYKKFLGVFSINLLPYVFAKRPSGLIVNLDPSYKPGSHWVQYSYRDMDRHTISIHMEALHLMKLLAF